MKHIYKVVFWGLFFISTLTLVKYCNLPAICFIGDMLIKPIDSDGILLNLAIGYIVSAIFYVIIVYYPEKIRKNKIEKIVINELTGVVMDVLLMFVVMYKNVCNEKQWEELILNEDSQFFTDDFYSKMKQFDAYAIADSPFTKIDVVSNERINISWHDKMEAILNETVNVIDGVLSKYILYIDDNLLQDILEFRNSEFLVAYLGLPSDRVYSITTDYEGNKHADRVSLFEIRTNSTKHSPLFADGDKSINIDLLKKCIKPFLEIRNSCLSNGSLRKDFAIGCYLKGNCGRTGIARIKYETQKNNIHQD